MITMTKLQSFRIIIIIMTQELCSLNTSSTILDSSMYLKS